MRMIKKFLALAVFALFANAANATMMKVEWDVFITSTFGGFPAPKTFSNTFIYDLDNLVSSSPTIKQYGLVSAETTVDSNTYLASGGTVSYQDQVPFTPPRDRVNFSSNFNFALDGINVSNITLVMEGPETIFDIGDVPFIPDPLDFPITLSGVAFTGGTCSGSCFVSGEIRDLQISQVPEPAVLALLSLGLVGIRFTQKKKSRPDRLN